MLKKYLPLFFLLTFPAHLPAQAKPSAEISPQASAILAKAKQRIAENRRVYDTQNSQVFTQTEQLLRAEVDRLIKANKPDEASTIQDLMLGFQRSLVESVDAEARAKAPIPPEQRIIGKWIYAYNPPSSKILGFLPGGKIESGNQNEHSWRVVSGKLEVLRDNGKVGRRFEWDADAARWVIADMKDVVFKEKNAYITAP